MKEKVIKKVLNEKKTITSIFLIVPSICLLAIGTFFIQMMFDTSFSDAIKQVEEVFISFGIIGVFGLGFTLYLMKFTNKLNVVKIPKEELEILYDQYIDDKVINNIESMAKQVKLGYEQSKKSVLYSIIGAIIVIAITGRIIFIEGINAFVGYLIGIVCMVSIIFLFAKIEIALKSIDRLVDEFREKQIIEIFSSKITNRNKEIIKENKNKEVKRKNPVVFWLIEIFLLIWCLAAFNKETLSLIETDGVYGFIAIIIIFGLPAFFFIRNIYKRYFTESK